MNHYDPFVKLHWIRTNFQKNSTLKFITLLFPKTKNASAASTIVRHTSSPHLHSRRNNTILISICCIFKIDFKSVMHQLWMSSRLPKQFFKKTCGKIRQWQHRAFQREKVSNVKRKCSNFNCIFRFRVRWLFFLVI